MLKSNAASIDSLTWSSRPKFRASLTSLIPWKALNRRELRSATLTSRRRRRRRKRRHSKDVDISIRDRVWPAMRAVVPIGSTTLASQEGEPTYVSFCGCTGMPTRKELRRQELERSTVAPSRCCIWSNPTCRDIGASTWSSTVQWIRHAYPFVLIRSSVCQFRTQRRSILLRPLASGRLTKFPQSDSQILKWWTRSYIGLY